MVWKSIKGFEGIYEANEKGQIRSLPRKWRLEHKILKPHPNGHGYLQVSLGGKTYPVHFLISYAFLGNRPTGFVVNHKDGNKTNNAAANLEYIHPWDNYEHANSLRKKNPMRRKKIVFLDKKRARELFHMGFSAIKIASLLDVSYITALRFKKSLT